MHPSIKLLRTCFWLSLILPRLTLAQTADSRPPTPGADGVYEVAASELKKLDSSPKVEMSAEAAVSEISDRVVIAVVVSPEGRVKKTKVLSGKFDSTKQAAERAVKKWVFQPFLVNGGAVPVRSEITVDIDNTLDHYREPNGEVPVHLDEATARTLLIKSPDPQYPELAQLARIQGIVSLRAIIGEDGRVHALRIIRGHPMLVSPAYNAVRTWQFRPYTEGGRVLPVDTTLSVSFKP